MFNALPHSFIHACMHACIQTYIHTYTITCLRAGMRIYMHAYIHTYIHTHTHNTLMHWQACADASPAGGEVYRCMPYRPASLVCVHLDTCMHR